MERDFLGLGFQVMQKIPQEITDSSIGMKSFDLAKEEKFKVGFEALGSASLMTIPTGDDLQPTISSYFCIMQQNMVCEKQEYRSSALTSSAKSFDSPFRHLYQGDRRIASSLSNETVHQSIRSPTGQNMVCSISPQPLLSAFQAKNNSNAAFVGTTEFRNTSVSTGVPTQLMTIFYDGSVYVYEDVSSEKAKEVMQLAGNGPSVGFPSVHQSPVQTPAVRPSGIDCSVVNRSHNNFKSSFSNQNSLASMSSSAPQSVGGSVFPDNAAAERTIGTLRSSPSKPETTPKELTVHYFRKASLARFLEKRKVRVINESPYSSDKKQP